MKVIGSLEGQFYNNIWDQKPERDSYTIQGQWNLVYLETHMKERQNRSDDVQYWLYKKTKGIMEVFI